MAAIKVQAFRILAPLVVRGFDHPAPTNLPFNNLYAIAPVDSASQRIPRPKHNRQHVSRALRIDQEGKSTFPEFLQSTWNAGVVKYDVDLEKRTCTYFGANGENYVEEYLAVEVKR